jgi:hypothetical protein
MASRCSGRAGHSGAPGPMVRARIFLVLTPLLAILVWASWGRLDTSRRAALERSDVEGSSFEARPAQLDAPDGGEDAASKSTASRPSAENDGAPNQQDRLMARADADDVAAPRAVASATESHTGPLAQTWTYFQLVGRVPGVPRDGVLPFEFEFSDGGQIGNMSRMPLAWSDDGVVSGELTHESPSEVLRTGRIVCTCSPDFAVPIRWSAADPVDHRRPQLGEHTIIRYRGEFTIPDLVTHTLSAAELDVDPSMALQLSTAQGRPDVLGNAVRGVWCFALPPWMSYSLTASNGLFGDLAVFQSDPAAAPRTVARSKPRVQVIARLPQDLGQQQGPWTCRWRIDAERHPELAQISESWSGLPRLSSPTLSEVLPDGTVQLTVASGDLREYAQLEFWPKFRRGTPFVQWRPMAEALEFRVLRR